MLPVTRRIGQTSHTSPSPAIDAGLSSENPTPAARAALPAKTGQKLILAFCLSVSYRRHAGFFSCAYARTFAETLIRSFVLQQYSHDVTASLILGTANMAERYIPEHRRTNFKAKSTFKPDELRRRREEQQVEIRKQKREENLAKRRGIGNRGDGAPGASLGAAPDSDDEGLNTESQVSLV